MVKLVISHCEIPSVACDQALTLRFPPQDHRGPVFPVEMAGPEVYEPSLEQSWGGAGKRGVCKAAPPAQSAHHLAVPAHHRYYVPDTKKEPTQLSPVKKRVKEGTPPTGKQHSK